MDFRGRIYSYVPFLNYQGSDLARGLLLFSNKGVVNNNNMKYLYYYCANVYGLSNKIYEKD
jgi:DNA-directed RNA polymerase